jgi:hypothetical protein
MARIRPTIIDPPGRMPARRAILAGFPRFITRILPMLRCLSFGLALCALLLAGCGGPPAAKVKGVVLENGQPKTFPATSHSVEIAPVSASGDVDKSRMFTAVVNTDGSFEVLASGGELPLGTYLFTVRGQTMNKKGGPPAGAKRELVGGVNEITIDLAKPSE